MNNSLLSHNNMVTYRKGSVVIRQVLLLKSLMRMNLFKMFAPKSGDFFDSFAQSTRNLVAMSQKFKELLDAKEGEREGLVREIHDLEHVGDQITHNLFIQLSENFITPFDREDIHYLATSLDDVADFINGTASRISLYQLKEIDQVMHGLASVLSRQIVEIDNAIQNLRNMKNAQRVREAIVRINDLENEADSIFDLAIARLFSEETNAIEMIKKKEILSVLETATDKCEDVANAIESILVKNS
jgi:predicted phosphate transport protein (TIGR00153 family)